MLAITPVTVTVLDDDGNGVVGQMVAVCPERQRCLVQLVQGGVFEEEEYELIDVAVHTGRFDGPDYKSTSPESVSKLFRETVCSEREGYQHSFLRCSSPPRLLPGRVLKPGPRITKRGQRLLRLVVPPR